MNIELTHKEIAHLTTRTIEKINGYPKRLGKTVENYFDVLFDDMVKWELCEREINRRGAENYMQRKNSFPARTRKAVKKGKINHEETRI